jgi:FlaG/FlaF family flagellin (archaellin)
MFITFESDAYENISYFNEVGKKLLAYMGHSGSVPGALKAEQVSVALNSLEKALEIEKQKTKPKTDEEEADAEISIAKRAVPLVALLKAAAAEKADVIWTWTTSP